jgi:hypothetical protein
MLMERGNGDRIFGLVVLQTIAELFGSNAEICDRLSAIDANLIWHMATCFIFVPLSITCRRSPLHHNR